MAKRLDTKLFSNGAEFLVMAKLLLTNIQTYKSYVNFEGYDLVCVNPIKNISAKIQIKSKNFLNDTSFYLNSDDKAKPDFYVFVQTNSIKKEKEKYILISDNKKEPMLYVLDLKTVETLRKQDKKGTYYLSISETQFTERDLYLNNWNMIKKFLGMELDII